MLLHGSPGRGADFARAAELLAARGLCVIAPDLPGFGASEADPPSMAMLAHAHAMLAFIDALGLRDVHVVGWSNAGGVAIHMGDLAAGGGGGAGRGAVASVTLLAAIGAQETESSGSYWMEHAKYAAGFAALGVAPELLPHFGLLPRMRERTAFVRNFWESDQRPLARVMAGLRAPTLVLHGERDLLVPCHAALTHAAIVPGATLVLIDGTHFMPVLHQREMADVLAWWTARAASPRERASDLGVAGDGSSDALHAAWRRGRDAPHARPLPTPSRALEDRAARGVHGLPFWAQLLLLAALVRWRPTLGVVLAALLVPALAVDWFVALCGIAAGMGVRSLAPALLARAGRGGASRGVLARLVEACPPISRRDWTLRMEAGPASAGWSHQFATRPRVWSAVGAGLADASRGAFARFVAARAGAVFVWAAASFVISWLAAVLIVRPVWRHAGMPASLLAVGVAAAAAKGGPMLLSVAGRRRLRQASARAWHYEYWPTKILYAPLLPWQVFQALRHGGAGTFMCCNPAIPASGGIIGESKYAIMHALGDHPAVLATRLIPAGDDADARLEALRRAMAATPAIEFPVILKPDSGYRGFGVKLASSDADAARYFRQMRSDAVVQPFHPGPNEVGVLWVRRHRPGAAPAGEPEGYIFSVNTKRFPVVVGDGRRTLERLLWEHPRFSRQAHVFLDRFADDASRVLAKGEELRLVVAGNHCQGTLFADGSHLITPELTRLIDGLARRFPAGGAGGVGRVGGGESGGGGLDSVRFDVRYDADADLRAGRDIAIIEMNGTTGESTNIYDPGKSLWWAYRVLFTHWRLLYELGEVRRREGVRPPSIPTLIAWGRRHVRTRTGSALSD